MTDIDKSFAKNILLIISNRGKEFLSEPLFELNPTIFKWYKKGAEHIIELIEVAICQLDKDREEKP